MTDVERNSFDTLVLLCIVHHGFVDKIRPGDFLDRRTGAVDGGAVNEASGPAVIATTASTRN